MEAPQLPDDMRALFILQEDATGKPQKLVSGQLRIPQPKEYEILVRIHACAVTKADICALDTHLTHPQMEHFIPGTSFCGVIPAQKHIPISFSVGDRVAGIVANGGWGEFVAVDIERIWKIEDDVSFAEGAAAAGDSYRIVSGIRDMKLLGGEHVLVAGGITAAGCMCMQLIRGLYGGRVVVAVEGERDAKLALKMRPEGVVDTLVERVCDVYAENSFDAAVDCVEIGDKICSVVRDGGTVVRSGQEKMGRVAKRKRISVVSMQANVDAEGVKVVRDIMQRVGVRVPCGPLFGVARYVEALDRGRQGVRSGAVVILF